MTNTADADNAALRGMDLDELSKTYQQRLFDLNAERDGHRRCKAKMAEARDDLQRQRLAYERAADRLERCHEEVRVRTTE